MRACGRILAAAILIALCAGATSEDTLQANAIRFEQHWSPFVRALFGCSRVPEVPMNRETCSPARALIDYAAYRQSREAARVLFDFREK